MRKPPQETPSTWTGSVTQIEKLNTTFRRQACAEQALRRSAKTAIHEVKTPRYNAEMKHPAADISKDAKR